MKYCSDCGSYLLANAKFCHSCGTQVVLVPIQICPKCNSENPKDIKFCGDCGFDFQKMLQAQKSLQASFAFNLDYHAIATLPMQLKTCFVAYIQHAIIQDGLQDYATAIEDIFLYSYFRQEYLEENLIIWTGQIESIMQNPSITAVYDIEDLLIAAFKKAYHYLLVVYAKEVLPAPLSSDVLPFWGASQITMEPLIKAYLKAEQEQNLCIYSGILNMPLPALQEAQKQFFFATSQSDIPLLFVDQSLMQTGAQGLIITNDALFWKVPFHVPCKVEFRAIQSLAYTSKGLYINDKYFHIEKGFDFKCFKLLQYTHYFYNKKA